MRPLPDVVRGLLEQPSLAHVATLMPDGAPHSVPVWIGIEEGRPAFLTSPSSRKARNLNRDPRVSISMTAAEVPTTMAQLRGQVDTPIDGVKAWQIIDRLSYKYLGVPYPLREDRVVFLVNVERVWGQAFA